MPLGNLKLGLKPRANDGVMPATDEIVSQITRKLEEWGITNYHIEEYESEKIVIVEFSEDFALYISVACIGNECSVDYGIGDDNLAIRPEHVDKLPQVVDLIRRINDEIVKNVIRA